MRRVITGVLIGALLAGGAILAGPVRPALADGPVTITATGPATVATTAGRGTATSWATFTVIDTSGTATSMDFCRIMSTGRRVGCDTVALVPSNYADGNWHVMAIPGGYSVRYRIGYYDMSATECWDAAVRKPGPYRISAEVTNPGGVVLATASHPYQVTCTGLAGASSGPKRLVVHSGRSSAKASLKFWLLDTDRVTDSIRVCAYNEISDRYYDCERQYLKKSNVWKDKGWFVAYSSWWNGVGSSLCSYIGRKWPSAGIRVEFFDDDLKKRFTLYRDYRLECTG